MNPKISSINKNPFVVRSWRSCLQLPVVLVILCWSSLAQAQFQTETWLGAASGTSTWTNILAWTPHGTFAVSSNGDALIFGSQTQITLPGFTNSVNNFQNHHHQYHAAYHQPFRDLFDHFQQQRIQSFRQRPANHQRHHGQFPRGQHQRRAKFGVNSPHAWQITNLPEQHRHYWDERELFYEHG